MKTVFAILFLCSVAGSQAKTAQQSSKHPHDDGGCYPYSKALMSACVGDAAQARYMMQDSQRKQELYWALRTRVLTDKEMAEVEQYDYNLLTRPMEPYTPSEVKAEFNQALLIQYKIRDIANRAQRCAHSEASGKSDSEKPKEAFGEASR